MLPCLAALHAPQLAEIVLQFDDCFGVHVEFWPL